jgi:hypothetical protein
MDSVHQKRRAKLFRFLSAHGSLLATQGSVQGSYRRYQGRKLGPFFRLSFREAGKQRSLYIGRDQALAAEIQAHVQKLQAPRAQARQLERSLADCRRNLKLAKLEFRCRLQTQGLRLRGNEIRGWRTHRQLGSAPSTLPVQTLSMPSTHPARGNTAIGTERSASASSPMSRRLFCWDKRSCPHPRFVAGHGCQSNSTPRECQPEEYALAPPGPWAQNHALKRIPDAVF